MTRQIRFDTVRLNEIAGQPVFERGQTYAREGRVDLLSVGPDRIVARVRGSEDYRVEITGQGDQFDCECSCPAFEREEFCKHIVAVALRAEEASSKDETAVDCFGEIRSYLQAKDRMDLVEMILGAAERDPELLQKLQLAVAVDNSDDDGLSSHFRALIREATQLNEYVGYWQVPAWADGVNAVLDMLADIASGPRAELALEIASNAIARIEHAILEIDDSDGHGSMLLNRAQQIHLEACRAAKPDPETLARDLFRREMSEEFEAFEDAAIQYEEVLGEKGLAEYRRLAQETNSKLSSPKGARPDDEELVVNEYRLTGILDYFAERDGDFEIRVKLRRKNLTSSWDHLRLAEFYLAHDCEEEALRQAEEALWLFEDNDPDERLVGFTADLLIKKNRKEEAEAYLWQAFRKAPSMNLYTRLQVLGGKAASKKALSQLRKEVADGTNLERFWKSPSDLLVRILTGEKLYSEAWSTVREFGAMLPTTEELAKASEVTHAQDVVVYYEARVETLATAGGNSAYEEAAGLIARMAHLRAVDEQEAFLSDIKERHKRKRNFMKLLG